MPSELVSGVIDSALDPISTAKVEELIQELSENYTIAIVTHNMQQAARASDNTAFFNLEESGKPGRLVEIGATETIFWLAAAYGGVALLEQALKLALNLYRAWVSEDATRGLRRTLEDIQEDAGDAGAAGKHAAMAVAEAEPIGGFVGMAISEPLLQVGILVSVIGYMTFLEPWALALSAGFLLPQVLFVPIMQIAINRRAEKRIRVLRRVSGDIFESGVPTDERIERVFQLNMGIYKIKYSMNLLMNFMHYGAVAVALGVGGAGAALAKNGADDPPGHE